MSHPAIDPSVEAANSLGGYEFRHMSDIRNFTSAAPESIAALAAAYAAVANRLADTPAASGVAEVYSQIAGSLSASADTAGEASGLLAAANQDDFQRIDNPRPNEGMADYGPNAAG
jgi:hypothetical protein